MTTRAPRALTVSVASGAISGIALFVAGDLDIGLFLPGVVFGIVTGLTLGRPGWRFALWCIASTVAWYAALMVFIAGASDSINLFGGEPSTLSEEWLGPWVLAGAAGAGLLLAARWAIYRRMPVPRPWLAVVAGAALAVVMGVISKVDADGPAEIVIVVVIFALWQGGVGYVLLRPAVAPAAAPPDDPQARPTEK